MVIKPGAAAENKAHHYSTFSGKKQQSREESVMETQRNPNSSGCKGTNLETPPNPTSALVKKWGKISFLCIDFFLLIKKRKSVNTGSANVHAEAVEAEGPS